MTTRFVVILDGATPEQKDRLTLFLQQTKYAWWHFIDNTWLLTDLPVGYTPRTLYEEIASSANLKDARMLVLSFNNSVAFWGSLGPQAWPWLNQYFGVPQ